MTIASKLFYYRRTRVGSRISEREEEPELDPPHRLSRLRRGGSGAADHDDHRDHRYPPASQRHLSRRLLGQPELPSSVLQARARLVERLGSFHLNESRQQNFASRVAVDEYKYGEGPRIDSGNSKPGTSTELLGSAAPLDIPALEMYQLSSLDISKKPAALSWIGLHRLQEEAYLDAEEGAGTPKSLLECSICLDRFSNEEVLIRLQCGHRFHHACLEPWLQAHGVCPYCRSSTLVG